MGERDIVAALAVQYVLSTLRLDEAATDRILGEMTEDEVKQVAMAAQFLHDRAHDHLRSRERAVPAEARSRYDALTLKARARVAAMSPGRRADAERAVAEGYRRAEDIVAGRRDPLVG